MSGAEIAAGAFFVLDKENEAEQDHHRTEERIQTDQTKPYQTGEVGATEKSVNTAGGDGFLQVLRSEFSCEAPQAALSEPQQGAQCSTSTSDMAG